MTLKIRSNGQPVDTTRLIFSGGEVQVRLKPCPDWGPIIDIRADIRSSDDLMELLLVTDALRHRYGGDIDIHLKCPYPPYARQDRVCAPGEALSLRVFCDLINAQRYKTVTVWDAHSSVAQALLDRLIHVPAAAFMPALIQHLKADVVVIAPDAGALRRATECAAILGVEAVHADKVRNVDTGAILSTRVHCSHIGASSFLMVDDICDGGRTFIALAKFLKEMTDGKILLYVTHGIFSQGFEPFEGIIDHIYCANPIGLGDVLTTPSILTVL